MLIFKARKIWIEPAMRIVEAKLGSSKTCEYPHELQDWVMEIKSKAMGQSKTEMLWTSKRCRQQTANGVDSTI
jgi:hypothetical protein